MPDAPTFKGTADLLATNPLQSRGVNFISSTMNASSVSFIS